MKRNSVTLLKYLIFAAVFLIVGPISLKLIFSNKDSSEPFVQVQRGNNVFPQPPNGKQHRLTSLGPRIKNNIGDDAVDAEKKDWHDYERIAQEKARTGPGEQGSAVILSAADEVKKSALYKVNGFNAYASDKISLDRAIKDIRHPDCLHKKYLSKLLTASVVVPFHNEHWTTLLRTAQSVINRSPPELLHEVILVDDFSNKEFLKQPLDDYLATHFDGKVKVVRQAKREGLIRTRIAGANVATGDVLIFLDSHVEANVNWLPPLLEPIAENYKCVVCPFIDVIDYETFAYRAQDEGARGAFDWEFFYKRLPLLPEDLKHPAKPFKSPVMAGGLFAISRKWFWDLGGYDPGLDIWGGEQYELSFKIWQCGGEMVDAACSRVGHIYRKFAPFPNPGVGDFVGRNYKRVAEVWMDEYKEYLYKRRPHYRRIDTGDISEQLAIRLKHNCKPFKWFMKEVAFDLVNHYPPVEPPNQAEGELRNKASNLCVDTKFRGQNERFGMESCIKDSPGAGGEQQFELTWHKDIRPRKRSVCFDVSQSIRKAPVILYNCHGMKGNQHWKYNPETQQLYHPVSGQCLEGDPEGRDVYMLGCDKDSDKQKWLFEKTNATLIHQEWKAPFE